MSERCPDCAVAMETEKVGNVPLAACPSCQAVAIARDHVLKLRGVDRTGHLVLQTAGAKQPSQAHRRPHHVAHQRLGVASGQPYVVVDGETRVFPGRQQLQPLLTTTVTRPEGSSPADGSSRQRMPCPLWRRHRRWSMST